MASQPFEQDATLAMSTPEQIGEVARALQILDTELQILENHVARLGDRIAPVLRQPTTSAPPGPDIEMPTVAIAERVLRCSLNVAGQNSILLDLYERVGL